MTGPRAVFPLPVRQLQFVSCTHTHRFQDNTPCRNHRRTSTKSIPFLAVSFPIGSIQHALIFFRVWFLFSCVPSSCYVCFTEPNTLNIFINLSNLCARYVSAMKGARKDPPIYKALHCCLLFQMHEPCTCIIFTHLERAVYTCMFTDVTLYRLC